MSSKVNDCSMDESGMSDMTKAGCEEQIIPGVAGAVLGTGFPHITPWLLGVGPPAVLDIGELLDTVTPFIVTSVGALISNIGTDGRVGWPEGGGAGTLGCDLGTMVASLGPTWWSGLVQRDLFLFVLGGGIGGDSGGGVRCITGLFMKEGSLLDSEIFESGQFSFPSLSSLQKLFTREGFSAFSLGIVTFGILRPLSFITVLTQSLAL